MGEFIIKSVKLHSYNFRRWYVLLLAYATGHLAGRIMIHPEFLEQLTNSKHNITNLKKRKINVEIALHTLQDEKRDSIKRLIKERNQGLKTIHGQDANDKKIKMNALKKKYSNEISTLLSGYKEKKRVLKNEYLEARRDLEEIETYDHLIGERIRLHF